MAPSAIEFETEPEESIVVVQEEVVRLSDDYLAWVEEQEAKLVTEDDKPVDNLFSEQQQRLLVETLYTGWAPPPNEEFPQGGRSFWGATNVGVFATLGARAIVPDVFLSLDVTRPEYPRFKSYFLWRLGKSPDVVIEIVSNTIGGELSGKKRAYARLHVPYYVVFDPFEYLRQDVLQIFALSGDGYHRTERAEFPGLGLGLTLWQGVYENSENTYLRWIDHEGSLLPTGSEAKAQATERAAHEAERAAREAAARQEAESRAERLAAKLRELGLDPEQP